MMRRSLSTAVIATFMLLLCSAALAQEPGPGYGYIEAGYLNVDPDDVDGSGDSYYGELSIGFLKSFHASGRYITGDYADDLDLAVWRFAAGWHGLLGEKGDIVAEATWTDTEIEDASDDGVGLTGGVRWRFVKMFEADGFVHWTDYSDFDSTTSYEARGIFFFGRFGVGAAATFSSDDTRYNAFFRFNFGKD